MSDLPVPDRGDLHGLVAGRDVYLRSPQLAVVEPTPELTELVAAAGARFGVHSSGDRVAAMHLDDRGAYFTGFAAVLADPGAVATAEYRIAARDGWTTEHVLFANLADDPGVGAIVIAVALTGDQPAVIRSEDDHASGEYDGIPWVLVSVGQDTSTLAVDGNVEAMTGRTAEEVIGGHVIDWMHPESYDNVLAMMVHLLGNPGSTRHSRDRFVHPDGTEVWVEATLVNRLTADGGDILLLAIDITARKAQEEALAASHDALSASHEEFRLLAEQAGVAIFRADADGRLTFRNRRLTELCGDDAELLTDLFHPDAHDDVVAALREPSGAVEFPGRDDGTVLALTANAVGSGFVGSVTDVTATVGLRRRAETDALTGLLNRQSIEEHLVALRDSDATGGLVVFVDLDGFKSVNDTYGHSAGDLVLQVVAERLRAALGRADVIGRYGGDEFVVLCPRQADDAEIVGRLTEALRAPISWPDGSWTPSASIGTASPRPGESITHVLERADLAMYRTKRRHHLRAV